jgi:hypothetical protein
MSIESCLTAPFLVMFTFGFFYVAVMSFVTQRVHQPAASAAAESHAKD